MPTDVIHTVGPGGTYADLQAAADAVARDVVALDEIPRFQCFGGANVGNLTGPVLLNQGGWNTDAAHPIVVEAAPGHEHASKGELDTSKAYLQGNGNFSGAGQLQTAEHLVVRGMQLDLFTTQHLSHNIYGTGGGSIRIEKCLLRWELDPAIGNTCDGPNLEWRAPEADGHVFNSYLIARFATASQATWQVYLQGASATPRVLKIRSSTIYCEGGGGGAKTCLYARDNHTIDCDNSYLARPSNSVFGVKFQAGGGVVTIGQNCATNNAEAPNPSLRNAALDSTTFESVTHGSRDLTPASSSPLLDAASDGTADGITEDAIGTPRPGGTSNDVGALERIVVTVVQASLAMGGGSAMSMSSTAKRIESLNLAGTGAVSIASIRKRIASFGFAGASGVAVDQIAKLEAALAFGGTGGIDLTTGPLKVVADLDLGGTSGLSVTVGTLRKVIALAFAGEGGVALAAEALIENGFVQAASRAIFRLKSMTESAIYYPAGNLGAGKSIRVVCEREPIAMLEVSDYTQGHSIVIELARDASLGVLEVRENEDRIDVSLVEGKPKERLLVNSILQSDAGVYRILATR